MSQSSEWQQIKTLIWIPIVLALVFWAVVMLDFRKNPIEHGGSLSFSVGSSESAATGYQYDGFYKVSAGSLVADTLSGLVSSPAFVKETFDLAGIQVPKQKITNVGRVFKTQKSSADSQLVSVFVSGYNEDETNRLLSSTKTTLTKTFDDLKKTNNIATNFNISVTDPVVIENPKNPVLLSIVAILAGLLFGTAISVLVASFRKA